METPKATRDRVSRAVKDTAREKGWPVAFERMITPAYQEFMVALMKEMRDGSNPINVRSACIVLIATILRDTLKATTPAEAVEATLEAAIQAILQELASPLGQADESNPQ
jgi:hypothetical protein